MKFEGHLHTHTEYSMLDGMSKIEELILRAKEYGQTGIAITDHGSSSGLYEAYKLGKKHNFNVLLGEEFYLENEITELKTGHLILIAKDKTGLANIFKLQSLAYDNVYYKPRINLEMLKEYGDGLICTTACIANPIGQLILRNEPELALEYILKLKKIFKDNLYVELQSTTNTDVEKVNIKLQEFIDNFKLKCICTTDIHYVLKEDYKLHEVLLAMQQQKKMSDKKRWRFENNDYYLKTEEEMKKDLKGISNTTIEKCFEGISEIFEKCKGVEYEKGNYLPKYLDTKQDEDNELRIVTMKGYKNKVCARNENSNTFAKDLEKELSVISETGYSGYFLIVREYIRWAKENGILVGDGRGSGAGSKVAYTIDITDVNPEKYNLLFERFLSIGREPDFDVDFSDIDKVFKHLQDKYGRTNVARVGAYTRLTCKSGLRKIMSTYSFTQSEIAVIVSYLPKELTFTLEDAIKHSKEFKKWLEEHEEIYLPLKRFEGMKEHHSTHAGGIIICQDLTSKLPTLTTADDRNKLIVAMDKEEIEELGHYKFDILGLSSLTLMKNITDYTGKIDWKDVDYEDKNIYNMLCSGDVLGVFQLSDQKDKVMQQQPRCFEDLIAINALIRPGVCDWNEYLKNRKENVQSELDYMNCTNGLIVYQDQYLQLAQTYAGWDIAYSDKHIRKNKDILNDVILKEKWMKDTGGKEDLWNVICNIVSHGYGFNRAHSTSYAVLSYQTAYMKYYYPKEFYASYMTQNINKIDKLNEVINIVKEKGIKLLTPDINEASDTFKPTEDGILFPLNSIKGIGGSALYEIKRISPITSFDDLIERRQKKFIRNSTIQLLIKAGAFDRYGKDRYDLLKEFTGEEIEKKNNYVYEKEAFGFYINNSPLSKYSARRLDTYSNGDFVITVGEITDIAERYDKRGNKMGFVTVVNDNETIKLVVFSTIWKRLSINEEDIVLIKGKKDKNNIIVNTMERIDEQPNTEIRISG